MPYIKTEYRTALDAKIADLARSIADLARSLPDETAFAGLLNYACTSLAIQVVELRFGKLRYGTIATVTGVFKNIADEFYRRVAAPYEDRQIAHNGDVPLYDELTRRIREGT
jgi:Domain of unknown function (DUF6899)